VDTAESRTPQPVRSGFAIYLDRRLIAIFAMGFASGLPLLLTGSTLSYWLAKRGIDKTSIGLFAAAGLPYALKFLWAPALDFVRVPVLDARFGRRRAWTLVAQAALAASILALGAVDPAHAPFATGLLAMLVAFCSATQDVAIDAYRIEILRESEQAAGAAATQTGYRLGLLAAGAGAIALSDYVAWPVVFRLLAALVGVGALAVLLAPRAPESDAGARIDFVHAFVEPLRDLAGRPAIGAIVAFALLYKFGDAVLGAMANPFYVELGFTGKEVASVTKVFGLAANVAGVLLGGAVVGRIGVWRALAIGGVLQALTHLLFSVQAHVGHDLAMLALAVGADSLAGGFAGSAFVAYFSSLCRTGMSATQYAVLTSLMAAGRTVLASGSGWLADELGWARFFVATTLLAAPGLGLLAYLHRRAGTETGSRGLLLG
jgi:MFS transporter, PAT family, beta-lactamase induction signal transducer AmpG